MRKHDVSDDLGSQAGCPRLRVWRNGLIFVVIVVLTPVAFELGTVLHAQWRSIIGRSIEVRTPLLDWLRRQFETIQESVRMAMLTQMPQYSWRSAPVLPMIAGLILIGMLFLRRGHHQHR